MYSDNEGKGENPFPKTKTKELVELLKFMTKETFIGAVNERRFVVIPKTATKFEVYMITRSEYEPGKFEHGMAVVVNPDTKDGSFRQTGGGYNKAHACLEDVAYYVDRNASDKDTNEESCVQYLQNRQRWTAL